jgi:opacity protein-like surface antigen
VFAQVGYGLSQADFTLSTLPGVSRTGDFKGLVAGAGFTRDISNGLFFRASYRYSDVGSDTLVFAGPVAVQSAESHDFSAGFGLAF